MDIKQNKNIKGDGKKTALQICCKFKEKFHVLLDYMLILLFMYSKEIRILSQNKIFFVNLSRNFRIILIANCGYVFPGYSVLMEVLTDAEYKGLLIVSG